MTSKWLADGEDCLQKSASKVAAVCGSFNTFYSESLIIFSNGDARLRLQPLLL